MNSDFKRNRINRKPRIFGLNFKILAMLLVIVIPTILYFSNKINSDKVLKAYCGDYGLYGKDLTLLHDNTFEFYYYGCSQSSGGYSGIWEIDSNILKLEYEFTDSLLQNKYIIVGDTLKSIVTARFEFVLCEEYLPPWSRELSDR